MDIPNIALEPLSGEGTINLPRLDFTYSDIPKKCFDGFFSYYYWFLQHSVDIAVLYAIALCT